MVCMYCQDSIGDKTYCLLCYSQESLVPLHGEELGKSFIATREELAPKYNFDSVDRLTIQKVEVYEVRQVGNARIICPVQCLFHCVSLVKWKLKIAGLN